MGFALIVAVVIWLVFEFFTRSQSEAEWKDRVEEITKNVFYGVLRRSLPPGLIREADVLVLNQNFLRIGLRLEYILEDCFYTISGVKKDFIKMTSTIRYTIRNVGDEPSDFPVSVHLPNPIITQLQDVCDVVSISIQRKNEARINQNIESQRAKFLDEKRKGWFLDHLAFSYGSLTLGPEEEAEIDITYVLAKETEDLEMFETLYPSDSVNVSIIDNTTAKRTIRARSHHPGTLENLTPGKDGPAYQYRLSRYLLPHQGVSFWWKSRPSSPGTAP